MTFAARTDGFVRGLTIAVLALLGVVVAASLRFLLVAPSDSVRFVVVFVAILFVAAIVVVSYGFAPRRYRLAQGSLWIDRPFGSLEYSMHGLRDAAPLDLWLGLCRKRPPGGNSGLFGLYGSFHHRDLGKFQMHARSASGGVILRWDDALLVVAPERREEFLRSVHASLAPARVSP